MMKAFKKESTKQLLSLTPEQRKKLFNEVEEETGVKLSTEVDKNLAKSSKSLSFGQVLFDTRTKNFVSIKYGRKGNDYVYHISFSRKPQFIDAKKVLFTIGRVAYSMIPEYIEGIIKPPATFQFDSESYTVDCYTLVIQKIANRPGARKKMEEELVNKLLNELNEELRLPGEMKRV